MTSLTTWSTFTRSSEGGQRKISTGADKLEIEYALQCQISVFLKFADFEHILTLRALGQIIFSPWEPDIKKNLTLLTVWTALEKCHFFPVAVEDIKII